jgi:hypothetical protein
MPPPCRPIAPITNLFRNRRLHHPLLIVYFARAVAFTLPPTSEVPKRDVPVLVQAPHWPPGR